MSAFRCLPCVDGQHHRCAYPGRCTCTIHPDTGVDEAPRDPLVKLRDVLDALTITLVCHPADEERVRTAAEEAGPPFRIVTSATVGPGQLVSWTADQVRTWAP